MLKIPLVQKKSWQKMTVLALCFLFLLVPGGFVYALVNINTAGSSELQTLTGIGSSKAEAIIEYRQVNGFFTAIGQIKNVSGIGDVTYENIKNDITIGETSEDDTPDSTDEDEEEVVEEKKTRPEVSVYADIQSSVTRAVVGMEIRFEGFKDAAREDRKPSYSWNFGDGTTGKGSVIFHTYAQPGTYVVSLETERYDKRRTDEIVIQVVDSSIALAQVIPGENGFVELENSTSVRINIEGWVLRNTLDQFVFPEGSYVAPESTVRFATGVLGMESLVNMELLDSMGQSVVKFPEGLVEIIPDSFYEDSKPSTGSVQKVSVPDDVEEEGVVQAAAAGLASGPPKQAGSDVWRWLLAVFGVVAVSSGVLFVLPQRRKDRDVLSADDIEIIE